MVGISSTIILIAAAAVVSHSAGAQTLAVVHSFAGPPSDGANPKSALIEDSNGDFWGTTSNGGTDTIDCGENGCGTVFEIAANGNYSIVHNFDNADGAAPIAGLVRDKKRNLWGTTYVGGAYGFGVVFKITAKGAYSVVHNFADDGLDGMSPNAALMLDADGDLWGTTVIGGVNGGGTVYEIAANGAYGVNHSFGVVGDGLFPYSSLIQDKNGNIFGTTGYGGVGSGCGGSGCGTAFEISANGYGLVHNFTNNGVDGYYPYAGLMADKKGNLWGTTVYGGAYTKGCGFAGCGGTVYEITAGGTYSIIHNFGAAGDSSYPLASLVEGKLMTIWGTTAPGSAGNSTIFEISRNGAYLTAYTLIGNQGSNPEGALIADKLGNLWGTAVNTSVNSGLGTVFEFTP